MAAHTTDSLLRRAFLVQYNVILLGGAALLSVASASWVPLVAFGPLELAWLVFGPRLPAFHRWVDAKDALSADAEDDGRLSMAAQSLDPAYSGRLARLGAVLSEIRLLGSQTRGEGRGQLAYALSGLGAVSDACLRLCQLHQRLSRFLDETKVESLAGELSRLREAFASERDLGVRVTLRQAMALVQRRIEQRDRIVAMRKAVEIRLDMLQSSAANVRSHGLTLTAPREMATEIGGLLAQMTTITALEREASESTVESVRPTALSLTEGSVAASVPR